MKRLLIRNISLIIAVFSLALLGFYVFQFAKGTQAVVGDINFGSGVGSTPSGGFTNLSSNIATTDPISTVTVTTTSGYPDSGLFQIENEIFSYRGKNATQFLNITRALFGTSAATHSGSLPIKNFAFVVNRQGGTGAYPALVVRGNGDLGVNTVNPTSVLDVHGTAHLRGTINGTGLTVGGSNTVGIGTTAPSADLEIDRSSANAATLRMENTEGTFEITNDAGLVNIASDNDSGPITRVTVDGDGNVGIGTTAPAQVLDVNGNIRISGGTGRIYGPGSSSTYGALTVQGDKGTWGGISFRGANGTLLGTMMASIDNFGWYNNADNGWDFLNTNGEPQIWSCAWVELGSNANTHCGAGDFINGLGKRGGSGDVYVQYEYCCDF